MVKSSPLPKGSVVLRPRSRTLAGAGFIFFLVMILVGTLIVAGVGLFAPTQLAVAQEQVLSLLNGGVADQKEEIFVDGCVILPDTDGPRAITRTRKTIIFRNGTSLEVTFSSSPQATNTQCP